MSSKDTGVKRKNIQSREEDQPVKVSRNDVATLRPSSNEQHTRSSSSDDDDHADRNQIVTISSDDRNENSHPTSTPLSDKASTSSPDEISAKAQTSNERSEFNIMGMSGGKAEIVNAAGIVHGNVGCTYGDKNSPFDNIVASTQKLIAAKQGNHVQTRAETKVPKILLENKCVFVKGKSGSGKKTLGLNILNEIWKQTKRIPILLSSWYQWDLIPVSAKGRDHQKYVVMIDNIFGSCTLVQSFLDEWTNLFNMIWSAVDNGNVLLVLLSRPEILPMCQNEIKQYKLIENIEYINLEQGEFALDREEKRKMLDSFCDGILEGFEKAKVVELDTGVGFPQCCNFFSRSVEAQQMGVKFFKNPSMYILQEVNTLHERDGLGYLVLLMLLMKDGELSDDELCFRPKTEFKTLVDDLKQCCQISDTPTMSQIREKAFALCGVFFTKTEDGFEFQHQSISDAVFLSISTKDMSICMEKCTPRLLVDYVRHCKVDGIETTVVVPNKHFGQLVDKITDFLLGELYEIILDHPCLRDEAFTKFMVEYWQDKTVQIIIEKTHKQNSKLTQSARLFNSSWNPHGTYYWYNYCSLLAHFILNSANDLVFYLLTRLTFATPIPTDALTCAIAVGNNNLIRLLLKRMHATKESFRLVCQTRGVDTDIIDIIFGSVHKTVTTVFPFFRDYDEDFHRLFRDTVLMGNTYLVHLFVSELGKSDDWLDTYSECLQIFIELRARNRDKFFIGKRAWFSGLGTEPTDYDTASVEEIIRVLLGTGCYVEKERLVWCAASHADATALRILLEDDTVCVTEMYLHQYRIPRTTFLKPQLTTPLHQAAAYGDIDCLSSLLARLSVSDINASTAARRGLEYGNSDTALSALHLAVIGNRLDHLQLLILSGANVNTQTALGKTPLHYAIGHGRSEMVKLLLENHASSNIKDASGQNAACYINENPRPSKEIVTLMLKFGINLHVTDNKERNPLHGACRCRERQTVENLCEYGLNVNNSDNEDNTVLHVACMDSNLDTVTYLCENGASVNAVNIAGQGVLHLACRNAHPVSVLSYLLDTNRLDVNCQDKKGNTVLHDACRHGKPETVKYLGEKGADFEVVNMDGQSVLHNACYNIQPKPMLSYLLDDVKTEVDLNLRENEGNTVLHFASEYADIDTVKYLCEKGASVNCVNSNGDTILHCAARSSPVDKEKLIYYLDELKLDAYVKNRQNVNPVGILFTYGRREYELVKLFQERGCCISDVIDLF